MEYQSEKGYWKDDKDYTSNEAFKFLSGWDKSIHITAIMMATLSDISYELYPGLFFSFYILLQADEIIVSQCFSNVL